MADAPAPLPLPTEGLKVSGVRSRVVTRGLSLPRHLRLGNTRPSGRAGDLDLRSTGLGRAPGRGVRGRSQPDEFSEDVVCVCVSVSE